MAASKAAVRYATALLDLSIEMKSLEKVNKDVLMIDGLLYDCRELVAFVASPIIQKRRKLEVFDALFDGKIEPLTLKFLRLLTKNKRENILEEITESFIKQYRKHKGIVDVDVKSAIKLEDNVRESIIARVKKDFEGDVQLHESVDEELIGGFVVRIEDQQIDASIKTQLADLRNILLN